MGGRKRGERESEQYATKHTGTSSVFTDWSQKENKTSSDSHRNVSHQSQAQAFNWLITDVITTPEEVISSYIVDLMWSDPFSSLSMRAHVDWNPSRKLQSVLAPLKFWSLAKKSDLPRNKNIGSLVNLVPRSFPFSPPREKPWERSCSLVSFFMPIH